MKKDEILERIQKSYDNFYNSNKEIITCNTDLIKDLQFDSLDVIEFSLHLEDEFHVEFDDEELENFRTIKEIINSIKKKTSGV